MSLKDKVVNGIKVSMKSGDKLRLEAFRMLRAMIIEYEKKGSDFVLTPDDELNILNSAVKSRKEALEIFQKAGRTDLAEIEEKGLQVINEFLPKQMTREEAETVIMRIIAEVGATSLKELGKVMGPAMKELKGKIDGSLVQEIVKNKLGGVV
jgi:uncharacterized protein YqeY